MSVPRDPHQRTSARRRLLRGALSAPAVLTVTTGSAFATASNARCLMNGTLNEPLDAVRSAADGFLRVQLHATNQTQDTEQLFVKGADFSAYTFGSFLVKGEWHRVNAAGSLIGEKLTQEPQGVVITNPPKFVLIRFDVAGKIVGVGPKMGSGRGANGAAIGASCWSSFTAP